MCECHEREDDWNLDELCSGDSVGDEREEMWDKAVDALPLLLECGAVLTCALLYCSFMPSGSDTFCFS